MLDNPTLLSDSQPTRRMLLSEAIAYRIKQLGVQTCFGLMSEETIGLIATLDTIGIRFCAVRHETNAVLAAEGYASMSGRLGIVIVGRGPASANALHGIMVAARSGSPVLVIMGEEEQRPAINALGPDYKTFNAPAVMAAAGLTAMKVFNPGDALGTFDAAVVAALRGQTITMHLAGSIFNADVAMAPAQVGLSDVMPPTVLAAGRPHAVEAAVALLARSKQPLIVAGLGAHHAGARQALETLAEKIGALLITSLKGKDLFRGSRLDLGLCGSFSHSVARKYVEQADCVLVFGAGLNFYTTSNGTFFPDVPIIQVDVDRAHIGRWYPADVAVAGDARSVAEQLLHAVPERSASDKPFHDDLTLREIAGFDIRRDVQVAHTNRTLDPRITAIELGRMLPAIRNVVYDAGNFMMVACYIPVPSPAHFRVTSDFASMGAGFGTALGVAVARPDEVTVLIVGDGGFVMTLQELETVARLGLRVVIAVFNDCAYGAELHMSRIHGLPEATTLFADVDFAPLAETLGFQSLTLRTPQDLENARDLLGACDGPILLDCKVNADVQAPFITELLEKLAKH